MAITAAVKSVDVKVRTRLVTLEVTVEASTAAAVKMAGVVVNGVR